jgi:hypothetical protein
MMKCLVFLPAVAVLGFIGCENIGGPISGDADFNPLRSPGSGSGLNAVGVTTFSAGQFVRAAIENTAFFRERPRGDADADKLLKRDTSMKVISTSGSYVKVELDSGEVGFVPMVMLEVQNSSASDPLTNPGEYQVYPPLPSGGPGEPLPIIDPAGLPPEGSIPQVIDPDAPSVEVPVPPVTPPNGTFPQPESLPLPPNGEE